MIEHLILTVALAIFATIGALISVILVLFYRSKDKK